MPAGAGAFSPTPAEVYSDVAGHSDGVPARPAAGTRHGQRAESGEQEPAGEQPGDVGTGLSKLRTLVAFVLTLALFFTLLAVVFAVLATLVAVLFAAAALVGLVGEGLGLAEDHQQDPVEHVEAQRLLRTTGALGVVEDNRLALVEQQAQDRGVTAVVGQSQAER